MHSSKLESKDTQVNRLLKNNDNNIYNRKKLMRIIKMQIKTY